MSNSSKSPSSAEGVGAQVVLAADVVYDPDLAWHFCRTLRHVMRAEVVASRQRAAAEAAAAAAAAAAWLGCK